MFISITLMESVSGTENKVGGDGDFAITSSLPILRILSKSKLSYDAKYIYSIKSDIWQELSFSKKMDQIDEKIG